MPIILVFLSAFLAANCNLFWFDEPSNDEQKLSAARACFDEGDLECALTHYRDLSSDYRDIARLEEAFVMLDRAGIQMKDFIAAFGTGGTGSALTMLADKLVPIANANKRGEIQAVLLQANEISGPAMRGLIRFIAGASLAAEILAETTAMGIQIAQTALTADPAGCVASANCLIPGQCPAVVGFLENDDDNNTPNLLNLSRAQVEAFTVGVGGLNLGLLHAAILEISAGLNQIGAGGKFNTGTFAFVTELNNKVGGGLSTFSAQCYRQFLIASRVGH